ncbi:MAG: hypothetical protein AB7U73_21270 [Pirellulales bacterium]
MSRRTRNLWAGTVVSMGVVVAAIILKPAWLSGFDNQSAKAANQLIVHEWGTFTSFSGSDGVNLDYRPLVHYDLPPFVNSPLSNLGNPLAKPRVVAQQRMETPVIYFYTDEPQTVNVRVRFPQGMLTEWYPPAKEFASGASSVDELTHATADSAAAPAATSADANSAHAANVAPAAAAENPDAAVAGEAPRNPVTDFWLASQQLERVRGGHAPVIDGNAYLDWGAVRLIPPQQFADVRVRNAKKQIVPAWLPKIADGHHYGRARETDAAVVEVVDRRGESHFEKFLFYRGLGNFELPIKLAALGNERFEVTNSGLETSGVLLLVRIEAERVRFVRLEPINPQSAIEIELPGSASSVAALAEAIVGELVAAGLYEREARAMVNTWHDSWFGETGTRLLYLVSSAPTEKLLPLTIEPAPAECVRVLVGRLETLTPEDCRRLVRSLTVELAAEAPAAEAIRAELAPLGRFAEPALRFVIGQTNDAAARERLQAILAELQPR